MSKVMLFGVKNVVAVASGKGGVGKTTVTVNLALAFQRHGLKVGIFDADIYGPNVPILLGIHRKQKGDGFAPIARRKEARPYIKPLRRFNLSVMSTGLLVAEDQVIDPARGSNAIGQFSVQTLKDVMWGNLDVLLLDLPPSAGQPQADLLKFVPIDGAIIVTTPQDLSLLDASRSLQLFEENEVPIWGVVENMSYFICPGCGEQHEIFHRSEKWRPPALADAPILGRIPLTPEISEGISPSAPLLAGNDEAPQARPFLEITTLLRQSLR